MSTDYGINQEVVVMEGRRVVTIIEVVVIVSVIVIVAAVLAPVFRPHGHSSPASSCQSNMTQIGRATKMYLSDWDDTYPTNCSRNGYVSSSAPLSPAVAKGGQRFFFGANWVEGLHDYIEATSGRSDNWSVWKCPACSRKPYPGDSKDASVSYVFNRNLIQLPDGYIASTANVMMAREADRLLDADLRPINLSRKNPNAPPQSPFLTKSDIRMGKTKPDLHNKGSHILFADGHVKYFSQEFFTDRPQWDPETQQWWNRVSGKPGIDKAIAITP